MILIDADILSYLAGFLSETRWYEVACEETGTFLSFTHIKEAKKFAGNPDRVVMKRQAESESEAQLILNTNLESIIDKCGGGDYKLFITDPVLANNFRVNHDPEYKQNRKSGVRPLHYDMLRQYMVDEWEATEVSGIEADDALGIALSTTYKGQSICAGIDKDLWQVPGMHYNISTKWKQKATNKGKLKLDRTSAKATLKGNGFIWFAAQMLMGDDVDNIRGLYRYGPVKAHDILEGSKTNREAWDRVVKEYEKKKQEHRLISNANLLWILRDHDDWFDPERIT